MNAFLRNLKIGRKLFLGYAFIIALTLALCAYNIVSILNVNNNYVGLQTGVNERNRIALQIGTEFAKTKYALAMAAVAYLNGDDGFVDSFKDFDRAVEKIGKLCDSPALINSEDTNALAIEIKRLITVDYMSTRNSSEAKILEDAKNGIDTPDPSIIAAIKDSSVMSIITEKINAMIEFTGVNVITMSEDINNSVNNGILWQILFIFLAVVLSALAAVLISSSICKPIKELSKAAKEVAGGNLGAAVRFESKDDIGVLSCAICDIADVFSFLAECTSDAYSKLKTGEIDVAIDVNMFQGDFRQFTEYFNETVIYIEASIFSVIGCAQEYAKGNFDAVVKRYEGPQEVLTITFDALQNNLQAVCRDLNELIQDAAEGRLDAKIDADRYEGDWKKISSGLNSLLEAVALPISETREVLEQVSEGNFNVSVNGGYKGSFAQMKNAVNRTIFNSNVYVKDISDILVKMSNRDLDVAITRDYVGDYAIIKSALTRIIDTFNRIIGEFKSSAEKVAAGARQISESSIMLSQGAVEQTSAVEETASTTEIISRQTTMNAQNSEKVRILSLEAKGKSDRSKQDMGVMLKSMLDIQAASQNISKIIKVIDDIAFQINLLALNAAVEAARAGSYGKGFSVVAEEVRNLAGKSKKAASDTAELINKTVDIIKNGTEIATSTAGSLNDMVEQFSDIATLIDDMSAASKEQAAAISQVNEGIAQIAEVTQINTASAEESASMSEELSSQAEALRATLTQFRQRAD